MCDQCLFRRVRVPGRFHSAMAPVAYCRLSVLALLLSLSVSFSNGELFTAIVDLQDLVYREREMKASLRSYIAMEEDRLDRIKGIYAKMEENHNLVGDDIVRFLGHPVNSYLIIRRYFKEWPEIEELVQQDNTEALVDAISKHKEAFPTREDYEGAITGLLRLQDTYRLSSRALAMGRLPGVKLSPRMSVGDSYDVGRQAYLNQDMFYTKVWMEETLRKIRREEEIENVEPFDVFDHLSFSEYQRGNFKKALNYSLEMIQIDPTHERAQDNVIYFGDQLKKYKITGEKGDSAVLPDSIVKPVDERDSLHQTLAFQNYEKLCRGEVRNLTKWELNQMKCWYFTGHLRYLIKPAKVERIFVKPELLIYHEIISDTEIRKVQELVSPRLRRATIQHPVTGKLEFATYRVSKSGWLKDEDDAVVRRYSQRIQDITGLDMSTAEELQVANYGIGGHYEPHYDFARNREDKFTSLGTGNRIATWLTYLSDVEAGGGTAFVNVGTVIFPKKGDAAFWYNLKKSGDGDDSTRHAACPVLVGNKWVANKWIHEKNQEFRRPCSRNRKE